MKSWALLLLLGCTSACTLTPSAARPTTRHALAQHENTASPILVERMRGLTVVLEQRGFRRGATEISGFLPNGDRMAQRVELPAHTCVAFVALGSAGMLDLDAGFYTSDGNPLIEDDNTDARPVLSLCTGGRAREVYYTLHAYQGGGAFFVQSFTRMESAADRALPDDLNSPAGMDAALSTRLKARGFEEDAPDMKVSLDGPSGLRIALAAKVARCYTLVAQAEASLHDPTLVVMDLKGNELARGVADGGPLALQFCAEKDEDLALMVRAESGRGNVLLSRFVATEERVGGRHSLWLGEPRH